MSTLIAIAVGGAAGALARYGVDQTIARRVSVIAGDFPWGTLAINVAGSFILGLLFVLMIEPASGPAWLRQALTVGFLSSFTTFSAFSMQTVTLAESGHPGLAIGYVLASVLLGVLAAAMAVLASRVSPAFGWIGGGVVILTAATALIRGR